MRWVSAFKSLSWEVGLCHDESHSLKQTPSITVSPEPGTETVLASSPVLPAAAAHTDTKRKTLSLQCQSVALKCHCCPGLRHVSSDNSIEG